MVQEAVNIEDASAQVLALCQDPLFQLLHLPLPC
jgi:hypothetical protein